MDQGPIACSERVKTSVEVSNEPCSSTNNNEKNSLDELMCYNLFGIYERPHKRIITDDDYAISIDESGYISR